MGTSQKQPKLYIYIYNVMHKHFKCAMLLYQVVLNCILSLCHYMFVWPLGFRFRVIPKVLQSGGKNDQFRHNRASNA
jgi:hypothetical protein